jgi:hypothetical protein
MANAEDIKILQKGVEEWNARRRELSGGYGEIGGDAPLGVALVARFPSVTVSSEHAVRPTHSGAAARGLQ